MREEGGEASGEERERGEEKQAGECGEYVGLT